MRTLRKEQVILIAYFFAEVGVGWFAAGVIGSVFDIGIQSTLERAGRAVLGVVFATVFLVIGVRLLGRSKR